MLTRLARIQSSRSLRVRCFSSPSPPKSAPTAAPKQSSAAQQGKSGGGISSITLGALVLLLGATGTAYYTIVEPNSPLSVAIENNPPVKELLNPFRKSFELAGVVLVEKPSAKRADSGTEQSTGATPNTGSTQPEDSKDALIETLKDAISNPKEAEPTTVETPAPTKEAEPAAQPSQESSIAEEVAIAAEDHLAATQVAAADTLHAATKHAKSEDQPAPLAAIAETPAPAPAHSEAPASTTSAKLGIQLHGVSPEEAARLTDSKVLKQALADSAREYIALRRDVEATLLKDIHQLNEHDLRIRIKQLATEMFERLAWEDLRMNQSLRGVQAELTEKYTDLMRRQHRELELEVAKVLFSFEQEAASKSAAQLKQMEATYQKQLEDTVRAQAEGFHATMKRELEEQATAIQTELQDQLNHEVAMLRKGQVDELLALQPQVQELHSQLEGIKLAVDATSDVIKKTIDVHHLSAAVLSLEMALSAPATFANHDSAVVQQLSAVRAACQGDEVVTAVLESLPERVAAHGALSLADLQVRFAVMREEVRKAALAPEFAPKMIGQLIGTVLATISIAPSGMISGNGAEETLARAAFYLERGRLADTLKELDSVEGYAQVLMQDWKALARERLIVDQSIRVLKANAVIRHKAFK